MSVIPRDYGGFSTNFLGVHLKFHTTGLFDHFSELFTRMEFVPPPESETLVDAISTGTVFEHELRHWHDFLICPSAFSGFRIRSGNYLILEPYLKSILMSKEFDTIPVPIQDWCQLDFGKRRQQSEIQRLWPDFKDSTYWNPKEVDITFSDNPAGDVEVVQLDNESLDYFLSKISHNLELIQLLRRGAAPEGKDFNITPRIVFEVSALVVQMASIVNTYGEEYLVTYTNTIFRRSRAPYLKVLLLSLKLFSCRNAREAQELRRQGYTSGYMELESVRWERVLTALTWCKLGDQEIDGGTACPASRFLALANAFMRGEERIFTDSLYSEHNFELWDNFFELTPFHASLPVATRVVEDRILKMKESVPDVDDAEVACLLIRILEGLRDARAKSVEKFLASPTEYCAPFHYLAHLNEWPGASVLMDLSPSGTGVSLSQERRHSIDEVAFWGDDGKKYSVEFYYENLIGESYVDIKDAIELRRRLSMADFFLEPDNLEAREEKTSREEILEHFGKRCPRVMRV